jgi:hypothetical protein
MSDKNEQQQNTTVSESKHLNEEYARLVKQIPWKSLEKIPEKLGSVGKMFGFKSEDIVLDKPLADILGFVKLVVTDINKLRKRINDTEDLARRVEKIEAKLGMSKQVEEKCES